MDQLTQLPFDSTYVAHESGFLDRWFAHGDELYNKMTENDNHAFRMMDGPPFVSGSLHIGHVAISALKSTVFNYKTMTGYNCKYTLGYDCHGLPIESVTEKNHMITSLEQKKQMGIKQFNKLCDETIDKYATSWTPIFKTIGRLANFDDTYMTRDLPFMETCIWLFKRLWDMKLVYKAHKVMWYSWACHTPLSNFEVSSNYIEIETKSVYVAFKLVNSNDYTTFAVAWTTTPWTLTANMALCVNSDIEYVELTLENSPHHYILGKDSVVRVFGKKKYVVVRQLRGNDLVGAEYEPVYHFISQINAKYERTHKFVIISDGYVKQGEQVGTSIVHIAPAFGSDDFRVCVDNNIVDNTSVFDYCLVDAEAKFDDNVPDYVGMRVFDADEKIRNDLKSRGILLQTFLYKHNYPHCYRTNTPLINIPTGSFFISASKLKDKMIELNKLTQWHPSEIGTNRFHSWLETTCDWAVSRNRSYGTPIPVWEASDGDMLCVGSIKELEDLSGTHVANLHPEYVNDLVIEKDGKIYHRTSSIFDCWFESGAVPFAQVHYPFDQGSRVIETYDFLSDIVIEGLDQTRGWFYTLMVLSCAILEKPPYKNVMSVGMVLDKNGQKISKRYGNYVDPTELIRQYGSDFVKLYLMSGPLIHAEPLKFDEKHIERIRQRFIPYINGVKFWLEHAINYQFQVLDKQLLNIQMKTVEDSENILDKWFLGKIDEMSHKINNLMKDYEIGRTISLLLDFIDDLTNWYIKFNRDRLKGLHGKEEWKTSLEILYTGLMKYCILWAPFAPLTSELIFSHLKWVNHHYEHVSSVLLCNYCVSENLPQHEYVQIVEDLQLICQSVRNLRNKTPKHNKQTVPLKVCTIYHNDRQYIERLKEHIGVIKKELNCIEIVFGDISDNVEYKMIPDRKALGNKFNKQCQQILRKIEAFTSDDVKNIANGTASFVHEGIEIDHIYYSVIRQCKTALNSENVASLIEREFMVSIDYTYTEEINYLYQIRRLHAAIQEMRKKIGVRPWNHVTVLLDKTFASEKIKNDIEQMSSNSTVVVTNMETVENKESFTFEFLDKQLDGYVAVIFDASQ